MVQTIKEDNKELMKRMKNLMNERTKLTKQFKKLKDQHIATRESLAGEYRSVCSASLSDWHRYRSLRELFIALDCSELALRWCGPLPLLR